ncbi:MAG: hypothetical protein KJO62_04375, partial [Gammaproteobacteria bacterium]|nr:hypothetical protein [Gammaproteobacteria bacterium]
CGELYQWRGFRARLKCDNLALLPVLTARPLKRDSHYLRAAIAAGSTGQIAEPEHQNTAP